MRVSLSSSPLQVWAIEDTSIQLTWGSLPPGEVTAWVGEAHTSVEHIGGPGSLQLTGLVPGRHHRIDVCWEGGRAQVEARTLAPPPGELLCRLATVSDLHLGATHWGLSKLMRDRSGHEVPYATRCATAAIQEAVDWGAELLMVKGDAAHHQEADHFRQVGELLDGFGDVPVVLIPGNHDVDGKGAVPVPAKVGDRGITYVRETACVDMPGLRVIVADTTLPGRGVGSIERVGDDIIELAALSSGPFMLGTHHQLDPSRVPRYYPIGIRAPSSTDFLDSLAAVNPAGLVTSGHTHRNRARRYRSLQMSEVASTRDWPGVWAGYAVYEGGVRQVVRRAVAHEAITWHEYSRRALIGIWEGWAAGQLDQRCFTHVWA